MQRVKESEYNAEYNRSNRRLRRLFEAEWPDCTVCGEPFQKSGKALTCSPKCSRLRRLSKIRERYWNNAEMREERKAYQRIYRLVGPKRDA